MHLIKTFHDYYDSVIGHNSSDPLKYQRTNMKHAEQLIPEIERAKGECWYTLRRKWAVFMQNARSSECIISVAGKAFCGFVVNEQKDESDYRFRMTYAKEIDKPAFIHDKQSYLRTLPEDYVLTKEEEEFFIGLKQLNGLLRMDEIHQKYKAPILRISVDDKEMFPAKGKGVRYCVERNPHLLLLNFQKVVDPYTLAQEVEMYVGGVLGNTTPPPQETSDKDRLLAKGFDAKISFRHRK